MDPAEGFAGFVAVVETGSISAAARALGLPRPTLSRQLARLEERLGVRLLHRSTRRLVPTPAGQELAVRARRVVEDAMAALAAVERVDDVPRGLLRVAVPPGIDTLAPIVAGFLARYPEVRVELTADTRHVDLVREGYDVALRAGTVRDASLVARRLAGSATVPVASPAYLARAGVPDAPEDLAGHALLLGFMGGHTPETAWPLRGGGAVPVVGRLATNDLHLRRGAALDGLGIALLPRLLVEPDLDAGTLVAVLEGVVGFDTAIALVYPDRAFLEPKVRAFVDHVAKAYAV